MVSLHSVTMSASIVLRIIASTRYQTRPTFSLIRTPCYVLLFPLYATSHITSIYLTSHFIYTKSMTYTVGHHIDLSYLNPPPKAGHTAMTQRVMSLPSKLLPGTRVSFLRMAKGMIVMSVIEPPTVLNVGFA